MSKQRKNPILSSEENSLILRKVLDEAEKLRNNPIENVNGGYSFSGPRIDEIFDSATDEVLNRNNTPKRKIPSSSPK